ncbi:MAG TPA: DUF3795 domain-containing protein [Clostridia bacterium]|nr:DUF3795 domain-containing protein [Clostridia bacterium]
MGYSQVVQKLAACGLDCSRCADHKNGEIRELSVRLSELLKGYERMAKIRSGVIPAFEGFGKFKEVLEAFANASCGGCRSNDIKCPIDCHVKTCHKEKGVDFCFQCNDYPCSSHIDERLKARWLEKNNRMKEIGVIEFFYEQSKSPRY